MSSAGGNITDVERLQRIREIEKLSEEGYTDQKISEKLGMGLMSVKRGKTYMKELQKADLTGKDIAKKRAETYVKLIEAETEAKILFDMYKTPITCPMCNGTGKVQGIRNKKEVMLLCSNCKGLGATHNAKNAEIFHIRWVDTIKNIADLYGLNSIKAENFVQINQQTNTYQTPETNISDEAEKLIRDALIESHENKVRNAKES